MIGDGASRVKRKKEEGKKKQSALTSPTSPSYTGTDMVTNVAYDIFTASTADGDPEFEIMIWLGAFGGAAPISGTDGPIATGVELAGTTWNLFNGPNGAMSVYSFVAESGDIENFEGDLMVFANYVSENYDLSAEQFVNSIGAGTEPFLGQDAVFTTTSYQITVT